jgi:hypothetical protein
MGLLAGGRAWLWITRAFLVLAMVVALMNLLTTRNEVQLLVAMDRMWVASPWVVRIWCAGVVVLGTIAVLNIGRATTTAPQRLRPLFVMLRYDEASGRDVNPDARS